MSQWYVARGQQKQGPFTLEQVRTALAQGRVLATDLAWTEGMAQWAAVGALPEFQPGHPAAASPPSAGENRGYQIDAGADAGGYYESYSQGHVHYAGFWLRFAACLIDSLVLFCVNLVLLFAMGITAGMAGALGNNKFVDDAVGLLGQLVLFAVQTMYFAIMESSESQATLGKMAVGIKVTTLDGRRLTLGNAVGRELAKIISGLICCVGYFMAGFTDKKQALHDMLAGTVVVMK